MFLNSVLVSGCAFPFLPGFSLAEQWPVFALLVNAMGDVTSLDNFNLIIWTYLGDNLHFGKK